GEICRQNRHKRKESPAHPSRQSVCRWQGRRGCWRRRDSGSASFIRGRHGARGDGDSPAIGRDCCRTGSYFARLYARRRGRRSARAGQKSRARCLVEPESGDSNGSRGASGGGPQSIAALFPEAAWAASSRFTLHHRDLKTPRFNSATMEKGRLNREIWGVVICLTALLIIMSLLTYRPGDRSFNTPSGAIDTNNWGGFVGPYLADILLQGLGFRGSLLPLILCLIGCQMFSAIYTPIPYSKVIGYGILLITTAVILDLFIESENAREAGGIVGGFLKEAVLVPLFGRISAVLISLSALLLSLMLLT